jgi:hypothetical protein
VRPERRQSLTDRLKQAGSGARDGPLSVSRRMTEPGGGVSIPTGPRCRIIQSSSLATMSRIVQVRSVSSAGANEKPRVRIPGWSQMSWPRRQSAGDPAPGVGGTAEDDHPSLAEARVMAPANALPRCAGNLPDRRGASRPRAPGRSPRPSRRPRPTLEHAARRRGLRRRGATPRPASSPRPGAYSHRWSRRPDGRSGPSCR